MARSKDPSKRDRQRESRDELIRHHLEEASTHIRAAAVAIEGGYPNHRGLAYCATMGGCLNRLHRHFGGVPHD